MKISKLFALGLFGTFLLNSCSSDDDGFVEVPEENEEQAYEEGVIILNEGSQTEGTVSFLDSEFTNVENNIFETVNPDMGLGGYLQSIFFDEDHAYIISNGSNLITVVDRETFEYEGVVDSGLTVPVYGVAYNGKAYVSNRNLTWGDGYTTDDFLTVIDLETLEVEKTIEAGKVLGQVFEKDGLIYVENASFGLGNSILVFNPETNAFEDTYELFVNNENETEGLTSIEIIDNVIYALSNQNLYTLNLSTGEELTKTDLSNIGSTNNLDIEDGIIYFTSGTSVYAITEGDLESPESPLFSYESTSAYGVMYGFAVEDDYIYTSDGGDFASAGTIEIYTTAGDFVAEFSVGIGPNSFYFND
ncbi:hypothetical protein SAMN04487907_102268 [Zunongwangia mangrovi]|uniref:40-residue YVTN family beta-propeller repeat-containing protein n=1 Tax=Zunongwangia mangrovi TaxID=1334022 RepID=A0A1I1GLM6_9FLAO|nr:DUF5074 domain-containing protein [Zunongwangia mangrovi]SFC10778.1 hypothetical protein SAMN04487907_102268 [Zunongwangia mangrovi]